MTNTKDQDIRRAVALTRRGLLKSAPAIVGGAALLGASGLLPNAQALAQDTGFSTPEYDAIVRKLVEGKVIKVGFTPPILSEFFDIMEHAAFRQAQNYTERFGVKWEWQRASPSGDFNSVEGQYNIIQNWITAGLDVIMVCTAGNYKDTEKIYADARAKGITIIQFNMPIELWPLAEVGDTASVGYDNILQSGYVAGKFIAEKLGGKGKVLQIWGPSGSIWSEARQKGFDMVLAEYPDLQVVGIADGGYVRDKGFAAGQNLLTANPDVNAVYGENEEMALGASQAIDSLGLMHWNGTEGVITIGADGLQSGFQAIREGRLSATISVGGVGQGLTLVETAFAIRALGMTVPKVNNVPVQLVEASNVDGVDALQAWALGATPL
jgi:ABC-type sugar transport system substrate-binding protein